MSIAQCLLALALYVGFAHSWDIAVGVGDQLVFYTNGTKTSTVNLISRNLTALAYDQLQNIMLYVDTQSTNDAICGYDISSRENKCFIKRTGSSIHSIAFDPATRKLFFSDTDDNSINWISLKPGSVKNVYGNILIEMHDRTPRDIAVDSCAGYIYWTNTNDRDYKQSMEKARLNGSGREIIERSYAPVQAFSLVIDPLTRELYYLDGIPNSINTYKHVWFNRADLNGKSEKVMYQILHGKFSVLEFTISKNFLYWVNSSDGYNTVWQLPKNAYNDKEPEKISKFYTKNPLAIATNYKIEDQVQGVQDCEALSSLIHTITVNNHSLNIDQTTETEPTTEYTTDFELFCVHGVHVSETSDCNCTPGYTGERCEVSVCHNYCLHGNCSSNDEGLPTCSCNAGYSGDRCEVYACHGYCLNDGNCSLNKEDDPVCQCAGNHEGLRCEAVKDVTFTTNNTSTYYTAGRNLTLADLLANWRKPSAKVTITVEV